ncbi:uncharacterized protein LOC141907767 [Tubulanus polymorphus]|uniref:uncharacterized protein LOC141907767 n=1 Tax=Tubulanus polymorphus TaxID=672921 RepID=UPI003DA3E8A8
MYSDVDHYLKSWHRCVIHKTPKPIQRAPIQPILTHQALELVCIDFLTVEPSKGFENLLVITYHFTKFSVVIPTKNQLAKTTARALYDEFIVKNATQSNNTVSPSEKWSGGENEFDLDSEIKWKDHLKTVVWQYNCTPHESTGYAPYTLLFGREPIIPVDQVFGLHRFRTKFSEELQQNLQKVWLEAYEK